MGLKDRFKTATERPAPKKVAKASSRRKPTKKRRVPKYPPPSGADAEWLHDKFEDLATDCYRKPLGVDVVFLRCRRTPAGQLVPYGCGFPRFEDAVGHRPNYDDMEVVALSRDASDVRATWDKENERWTFASFRH